MSLRHVLGHAGACGSAVRSRAKPCADSSLPSSIVALRLVEGEILRGRQSQPPVLRLARFPRPAATEAELAAWVSELADADEGSSGGGTWRARTSSRGHRHTPAVRTPRPARGCHRRRTAKQPAPPLRGAQPPGWPARAQAAFHSWGYLLVLLCLGAGGAAFLFADELRQWYAKLSKAAAAGAARPSASSSSSSSSSSPPPRQAEPADGGAERTGSSSASDRRASGGGNGNGSRAAPAGPPPGVPQLSEQTLEPILAGGSYVLLFVTNTGVAERSTVHSLAAHFDAELRGGERRGWSVALLDYSAESTRPGKPPLLAALLPRVRHSVACVLRKGCKLATFGGTAAARPIDDWLASLRMGEVSWAELNLAAGSGEASRA